MKISVVDAEPLLCSFAGQPPQQDCPVHINKKHKRTGNDIVVEVDNDEVKYVGNSLDKKATPYKFAIGIVDKTRGTLQLAECPVIPMETHVTRLANLNEDRQLLKRVSESDRRVLGETFGTNKARKALKAYDKGKINTDNMAAVGEISSEVDQLSKNLKTQEEVEKEAEVSRLIPPYDSETTEVDQIYKIQDLVTEQEQKCLPVANVMSYDSEKLKELRAQSAYCPYVIERLEAAIRRGEKKKVTCLLYLDYLIKLLSLSSKRSFKEEIVSATLSSPPREIQSRLVDLFTERTDTKKYASSFRLTFPRLNISIGFKNKLLSYICAITLHIEDFVVNIKDMSKELSLTQSKLLDYYRQLGCNVEQSKGDKIVRLKAPVVFVKATRGRKK
ncbi:hypothetical protein MP638_004938 [Amoeboaphelidium occidentale]|nr:hypothetical protein MP638_004938 [Amoeboaphelidium occidentale]